MPGCNQILAGIAKDCGPNMGGIKRVLLNNSDNVTKPTVDATTGKILSVAVKEGAEKFREFEVPKGTASLANTLTADSSAGTNFVTNVLTLAFNKMETSKRIALSALAVNELVAIVVDNNGKAWYVGIDEPLTSSGGDSGTGTAKTDRNGYGITLQNEEASYPYEVDSTFDLDTITE